MKKVFKYLTVVLFVLLVTGCDLKDLEEKPNISEKKIEKLTYKISDLFKKSKLSNEKSHFYSYSDKYSHSVCNFSVSAMEPFNRDLDIIIKSYMFSEEERQSKEKKINNQVWKYASDSRKTQGEYYVYTTIYQDKLYVIQYDDMGTNSECNDIIKETMNSLKMEE